MTWYSYAATTYRRPAVPGRPQTNAMAIVAFVFALTCFPLAIPCGHLARAQMKRSGESGRGLATAALLLGYSFTMVPVAIAVVVLLIPLLR
jgi:hypothetical protein